MKRYVNWFLNGFAITFALPSLLIIISWNAIPGDRLYGLKTGLEKIALGITIKTPLASFLTVKYTERRFSEADVLLSKKGSTLGYSLLVTEAKQSSQILKDKKDKTEAKVLIKKIQDYKAGIKAKKLEVQVAGQTTIPVAAPTTSTNPAPSQPNPQTPVTETTNQIIENLTNTEDELDEIEDGLTTIQSLSPTLNPSVPLASPSGSGSGRHRERGNQQGSPGLQTGVQSPIPSVSPTATPSATPTATPTATPDPTPTPTP